jgi:tripeptidyl-peptidase-1
MRLNSIVAVVGTIAATAAAIAVPADHVLHEKRHAEPKKWVKRDALEAEHKLPMRIGLTQRNLDNGHSLLMDVSSPDSPNYSNWLSAEEIVDHFAPAKHTVDAVRSWLEASGVAAHRISQSANKQWLQFDAPVSEVNHLLKTKYHSFEHIASGAKQVACDEYHVPASVSEHIDYITPGLRLLAGGKAVTTGAKQRSSNHVEKRGFRSSASTPFAGPIFGKNLTKAALPKTTASMHRCNV